MTVFADRAGTLGPQRQPDRHRMVHLVARAGAVINGETDPGPRNAPQAVVDGLLKR